ncbi:MAG: DUF1150 family protein [Pseudomonadota bacterium]
MTDTPYFPTEGDNVAYIRLVPREDLPPQVQERTEGMEKIYSIHDESGQVLALVDDRQKAFSVALMNEFRPVSVH